MKKLIFVLAFLKLINPLFAQQKFDIEAHRGGRALMPENTIQAMKYALTSGATTLEMDVVISKDQQVLLSHDPYFSHVITTKADGSFVSKEEEAHLALYQMDYAQIKKFDVGMKVHPTFPKQKKLKAYKPLLSTLIDSVEYWAHQMKRPLPFYNIETKTSLGGDGVLNPKPAVFVALLMKVILDKNIVDRVIIQSFDPRTLVLVHQQYPRIQTALLIEKETHTSLQEDLQKLNFKPSIYSPSKELVDQAMVDACHQLGIKIIPWTVNQAAEMLTLKAMGVDGLISDDPQLAMDTIF